MKVTFKTGSEANYGNTNGELFFASNTKQIMLNGIKYIPKKLSELTNDSGFITSITKSMVEGVLTGNVTSHTHTFASITSKPNTLLGYGITETDFFSFDTHISKAGLFFKNDYANNLLYAIDKRANVTATTFTNISSLFNLNYDSPKKIEAGNTEVILIENLNTVIPMLAYGYLYVQLYWGNYAENITVEMYSKNGGADYKWRALSGLNNIYLWTFNNVNINYDIDKIRIAIKAKSDTSCLVSQILFLGRRMSINNSPLITNYIPNTFLYDVTAPKYVVTGGTSSQFLKGDGSLDSNTYALSSALGNYLPLTGGTLSGALTVPKLTSTGNILLGDSSLSAMVGSVGIQRYDETGFIGFLKDFNLDNSFNGVVLGWDGNYSLQENSVRIDASTFTYKGNNVWHSGNLKLGYISSGLSRAVQKDTNGNLFIVAPSLFEQGISNNYPKNLRWSNETEGQLVYDTEEASGNITTVEVGIPVANGTSKGFLKSTSEVTNVIGYTPCPVVSGTPYYKEDCLYLGSTEIGYTGIMEYGIQYTFNYGTKLPYLEDYTPDSIPRCVVLCFPDRSSNYRFLFWLSAFDEGDPYIARFYNSAYETWLTIDTASRQIILSYGNTWQS